jgi:hypothetical protein
MLTRRSFLQSSFTTALGLVVAQRPELDLGESGRFLARTNSLDSVDRPRTLIHPDFYPIHPERVVIIGGNGWLPRNTEEHRLRRRLACGRKLAAGKLDTILHLVHVLTNYYRKPQLFEAWATGVANRESLGATGLGNGFGLLHQFQDDGHVRLVNPPVDCVGWDAWDEKPVYAMIGHVFPPHHHRLPGLTMRVYVLTSLVARVLRQGTREMNLAAWRRIARMDRTTAARTANLAVARCLAESPMARSAATLQKTIALGPSQRHNWQASGSSVSPSQDHRIPNGESRFNMGDSHP